MINSLDYDFAELIIYAYCLTDKSEELRETPKLKYLCSATKDMYSKYKTASVYLAFSFL